MRLTEEELIDLVMNFREHKEIECARRIERAVLEKVADHAEKIVGRPARRFVEDCRAAAQEGEDA